MKNFFIFIMLACLSVELSFGQGQEAKTNANHILSVRTNDDNTCHKVVKDWELFSEGYDTLQQVVFWREVVNLDPEHYIIYSLESREILGYAETSEWNRKSPAAKKAFIEERRNDMEIPRGNTIVTAQGRQDFYLFQETIPNISKAVDIFNKDHTDPWYAQAILLIESPGARVKTSYAGARGSFQIMPEVGREMGLIVNETTDERTNFTKSAHAAAKLIRQNCVPQAKAMLNRRGIAFHETDLWFRLLVMHCYHAGAGNVNSALTSMGAKKGGKELIVKLWKTTAGGFGNESQNYSQIALAAIMELSNIVDSQGDIVCGQSEEEW